MALRLAGETFSVVQGLDGQGWVAEGKGKAGQIKLVVNYLSLLRIGQITYHPHHYLGSGLVAASRTANQLVVVPMDVPEKWTLDRIGLNVATAGSAGAEARLGIYNDDGSGAYPGSLLLDAGTVPCDSTGDKLITINQGLNPGRYWLASNVNSVATQPELRRSQYYLPYLGMGDLGGGSAYMLVYLTYTYGALPNPFPGGGNYSNAPYLIGFRISAVG